MYAKRSWRLLVGESPTMEVRNNTMYRVLRMSGNKTCEV